VRTSYIAIAHFLTSLGKVGTIRKIGKFGGSLKMVFFDHAKFGQGPLIGGRDIRGQTKLEFTGPEYVNPIRVPTPVKGHRKHYRQSRIINSST